MEHCATLSIVTITLLLIVWQLESILATETDYCSCYSFHTIRKSWEESNQHCQQNGGNLVSMETEEEYQFINKTIQSLDVSDNEWYIGLRNYRTGDWKWITGNNMTINNWLPSQPSGNGDCVKMIKDHKGLGLFDDINCLVYKMFTCEHSEAQKCLNTRSITTTWCSSQRKLVAPSKVMLPTLLGPLGVCYSIHTIKKTWAESSQYCQQNGGNLVSMEAEEEYQFINKTIQSLDIGYNEWYIGLRNGKTGDWKWITGQSMNINKWSPTQPSGSGDCVKMMKDYKGLGLFDDINCKKLQMFICEYKTDFLACDGGLKWCPLTATTKTPITTETVPHKIGK